MYTNMSEVHSLPSMMSCVVSVSNNTTAIHRPVTNYTLTYTSHFTKILSCNNRPITLYPSKLNDRLTFDIINCIMKLQWAMSNKNIAPFAVLIQSLTHQYKLSNNTNCSWSEHQFPHKVLVLHSNFPSNWNINTDLCDGRVFILYFLNVT